MLVHPAYTQDEDDRRPHSGNKERSSRRRRKESFSLPTFLRISLSTPIRHTEDTEDDDVWDAGGELPFFGCVLLGCFLCACAVGRKAAIERTMQYGAEKASLSAYIWL